MPVLPNELFISQHNPQSRKVKFENVDIKMKFNKLVTNIKIIKVTTPQLM